MALRNIVDVIEASNENGTEEDVLEFMNSQRHRIDPSMDCNLPLQLASRYGYARALREMLLDPRTDPSDCDNDALVSACIEGHYDVVSVLLMDCRVDPCVDQNKPLLSAILNKRRKVVEVLIRDKRVDPSFPNNTPLIVASELGHMKIVELLLLDLRVDPSSNNNAALIWASGKGNASVVEILCDDPRTDISDWHPDVDKWSVHVTEGVLPSARSRDSKRSDYLLLKRIESDSESDGCYEDIACAGEYEGALFEDDIQDNFRKRDAALQWAIRNGHESVIRILFRRYGEALPFTVETLKTFCRNQSASTISFIDTVSKEERGVKNDLFDFE